MKKNKVLLLITACVLTLGVLVACGRNNANDNVEVPPAGIERPTPQPITPDQIDVIELTFWHAMTGDHETALDNLVNDFNAQHPHIHVSHEFQGNYTELNQSLVSAAVAGRLPNMAQAVTDTVTTYMNDGIIVPLTPFFNQTFSQDEINDIVEVFREGVIWDGEFMSVPFGKSTRVLFYNLDLFEEYGIERAPQTWDELIEISNILKDESVGRFGMGFENGWAAEFIALTIQHGGEYIDEASATAHFGGPEGIAAAEFVMGLYNDGVARFAGEDNFLSGVFGAGNVAMYIGSSAGLPHVTSAVGGDFEWATAPLPTYNGNAASRFQGNDIVLFDNGASEAEKQAAWEFMAFTLRPEVTSLWAAQSGYIPVTYAGRLHPNWTNHIEARPYASAAAEQFDAGFMTARLSGASQVWTILGEELTNVRLGLYDTETALTRAQERAQAALDAGR